MSKIIELKAENVKRLKAIEIKPYGNMVVLGGKNGQGKTSVLDSIMYALGGKESLPKVPVRKGEERAVIVLETEDLIVRRTITAEGGTSLVVSNREGLKYPSPQSMLDGLVGRLSFDPLEFSRLKPETQATTLRQLVGLDLSALTQERQRHYDARTIVGRDVKSLENRIAVLPMAKAGLPDLEVSAGDIVKEQTAAMEHNAMNAKVRQEVINARSTLADAQKSLLEAKATRQELEDNIGLLKKKMDGLDSRIADYTRAVTDLDGRLESATREADVVEDKDISEFVTRLQALDLTNREIRQNAERKRLEGELKAKRKEQDGLSAQIDEVDARKTKLVAETKFPIDGLTVADDGGVMFNGLPLEQAASAEQLRVSVAIGIALNPKLRVLLIRDGSLLDEDSLALLLDMAQKSDAQVWIERVGTQGEVSVVIEDGMVRATPTEPAKKAGELL